MDVFNRIIQLLNEQGISYEHMKHDFVHRSEEAAKIRGSSFEEAAKALILEADGNIIMAVVLGPDKIDYGLLRKKLGVKNVCLASPEQVLEKTGLTIGSIPPFGNLWSIPMYIEENVAKKEYIVFSAGSHYDSIRMNASEYVRMVQGDVLSFCRQA